MEPTQDSSFPNPWAEEGIITIGVDFDDVLVPLMSKYLDFCREKFGIDLDVNSIKEPIFCKMFGCDSVEANEMFEQFTSDVKWWGELHNIPPSPECVKTLTNLKTMGYRLVIISARSTKFLDVTKKYVETFLPNIFDKVLVGNIWNDGEKKTKAQMCKEENCRFLIDDNIAYIHNVEGDGVTGLLFGNWSWTKQYARAFLTWDEIERFFK